MITFKSNIATVNASLANFQFSPKFESTISKIAMGLLRALQTATPVDTGRARAGWTATKLKPTLWRVSNNVEYVPYLEFGTRSCQTHAGFIRNTIKGYVPTALAIIRQANL